MINQNHLGKEIFPPTFIFLLSSCHLELYNFFFTNYVKILVFFEHFMDKYESFSDFQNEDVLTRLIHFVRNCAWVRLGVWILRFLLSWMHLMLGLGLLFGWYVLHRIVRCRFGLYLACLQACCRIQGLRRNRLQPGRIHRLADHHRGDS